MASIQELKAQIEILEWADDSLSSDVVREKIQELKDRLSELKRRYSEIQ